MACLPPETVLSLDARGEPAKFWDGVRSGVLQFGCNGDQQKLQTELADMTRSLGVDPDALFRALGNEWVLSLQVIEPQGVSDQTQEPNFLVPAFLVVAKAKDDTVLKLVQHLTAGPNGQPPAQQEMPGVVVYYVPTETPGPFPLQLAGACVDDVVLLGFFAAGGKVQSTGLWANSLPVMVLYQNIFAT